MKSMQDKVLDFLYNTVWGRKLLRLLIDRKVSACVGRLLDSSLSKVLIQPFLNKSGIDMSEYEVHDYQSFNDFFTRKIKKEKRPIEQSAQCLISPCDGAALVLPIDEDAVFHIKRSTYTVERLLRSKALAKRYRGGTAVILRLEVSDYHRYCHVDSGVVSEYRTIPGVFHTVQPIAVENHPVFHENTREYCMLRSDNFKDIIVMEVGALLVGRIVNDKTRHQVRRGEEKGRFEYGGSTIVLLLEKDAVSQDSWKKDMVERSAAGMETSVKMGEVLAEVAKH